MGAAWARSSPPALAWAHSGRPGTSRGSDSLSADRRAGSPRRQTLWRPKSRSASVRRSCSQRPAAQGWPGRRLDAPNYRSLQVPLGSSSPSVSLRKTLVRVSLVSRASQEEVRRKSVNLVEIPDNSPTFLPYRSFEGQERSRRAVLRDGDLPGCRCGESRQSASGRDCVCCLGPAPSPWGPDHGSRLSTGARNGARPES